VTSPVLELADVSKSYGGLRPLRIQRLTVSPAEHVAILGVDRPMAEVFVNLVTGASLPETGSVNVFGHPTASIADSTEWLAFVDRFGIVSERAVLLEALTVLQNLAVPFTLDIEPPSEESRARAAALAQEVGLQEAEWDQPVGALTGAARASVRLARALALDPAVLLLEHPTATVDRADVPALGRRLRSVADRRGAALVILTADRVFADLAGARLVTLDAATGRLAAPRAAGWFRRRLG
jgi:predicted ABC-type transport system involved in lysophospholipase L1 biosynthesis ATPase subunit